MCPHPRERARARPLAQLLLALVLAALPTVGRAAHPSTPPPTGHVVEGWIEDETGRLPGATVELADLRRTAVTDAQGAFHFPGVPAGSYSLEVNLPGFATLGRRFTVPAAAPLTVRLHRDLQFEEELVVSAAPWALRPLESARQVDLVDAGEVRLRGTASLGEALASVPGVANISTGSGLGTPVIRGLSENRIRILNDGVALNHQQFSFRHSPNVEPGFAERLELVRGPASVLYGPDAMGGVVNLIHAPLPTAVDGGRTIHGELAPGYASNTGEWNGHARLEGAVGGFGLRGQLQRRTAGDITTPQGALDNTDFTQSNATLMGGHSGAWGNMRVRWHRWQNETGLFRPTGFRLDLDDELFGVDVHVPTHAGTLEVLAAHQQNVRKAFPASLGGDPAVNLELTTLTGRLGFQHRPWGPLRKQLAIEYQGVENTARALRELLPDYQRGNVAVMAFEEVRLLDVPSGGWQRLILSVGARWDGHGLDVAPDPGRDLPEGWSRDYGAVIGSLGAVLRAREDLSLAASFGRGWRPPSAFELFADGIHGGVAAVQLGNRDLVEESNVNGEISLRYAGRRVRGSLSAYRNAFDDYIYLADTGETVTTPEGTLPVFAYRQADARIQGLEVSLDVAPLDWLDLGLAYTLLDTRNLETGSLLPQTPPDRLLARLRLDGGRWRGLAHSHLGLDLAFVGEGVVSGPNEPFGTPTDPYVLADLNAGIEWPVGRTRLTLALVVRNLLDREYTDFLWTYKAFAPNPGRDVRVTARWVF